jgi:hypothetical protein
MVEVKAVGASGCSVSFAISKAEQQYIEWTMKLHLRVSYNRLGISSFYTAVLHVYDMEEGSCRITDVATLLDEYVRRPHSPPRFGVRADAVSTSNTMLHALHTTPFINTTTQISLFDHLKSFETDDDKHV